MTTKEGRNGRQKWQSDSQTWQKNVTGTAKCCRLAELAKLADRTVAASTKLSLAGRKLAGSIVLWQRRGKRQADNVAAERD